MMKNFVTSILCSLMFCSCFGNNNKPKEQTCTEPATDNISIHEENTTSENHIKDNVWHFDVTKSYEKKRLYLQDIAEIEYVPIETTEFSLWRGREVYYIDEKYIIAANDHCGVMVHARNGKALYNFNKKGSGPNEYKEISDLCYDPKTNEVFILSMLTCKIYVYDINGNFKRSFNTGYTGRNRIYNIKIFNEKELYAYVFDNTFVRISRKDGKTISKKHFKSTKEMNLSINKDGFRANSSANTYIKSNENFILSTYASDTTYIYHPEFGMKPFIARVPSVHKMETPIFFFPGIDTPRYYMAYTIKKEWDFKANKGYPSQEYIFDKKLSQVYELEALINKDYIKGGHINLFGLNRAEVPADHCIRTIKAEKLYQDYKEGNLTGKLKEIAANLQEDDNPILMIVKFER